MSEHQEQAALFKFLLDDMDLLSAYIIENVSPELVVRLIDNLIIDSRMPNEGIRTGVSVV